MKAVRNSIFYLIFYTASIHALAAPPVCDVMDFKAKGDGVTKDTRAIQSAIDACTGTGGSVRLHDGVFLSGMIRLKSRMKLVIEPSATLKGTQDDQDYPDTQPNTDNTQLKTCRKALVYAERASELVIEGGGTIDGNGNIKKWIGTSVPEQKRPMPIYITQSSKVTIENIKVKNAAMWSIVNLETDDLIIRNVKIHSTLSGNRDGIDLVDCHRVLIEDSEITSEDDAICLKSGTARGVEDVVVRNSKVLKSTTSNGIKFGTASVGKFKNIIFDAMTIENVDKAAIAVESVDGADISNIVFRNIQFHNAGSAIFVLLGKRGNPPKVGTIDEIVFENITGDQMQHTWGSAISGVKLRPAWYAPRSLRYAPKNLVFRNIHIVTLGEQDGLSERPSPPEYDGQYPDPDLWGDLPASGFYFRHVDQVSLENVLIEASPDDARPVIVKEDVRP